MYIDVTDATFPTEVAERSKQTPVVIDLWAEWCEPCKQLGPIIEKVVGETGGKVLLAKVDVDANPQVAGAFQVQSIPAVFAMRDGKIVDSFVGAQPEAEVRKFVEGLLPADELSVIDQMVAAGDEGSLRSVLEMEPGHAGAVVALADLLVARGAETDVTEALALLERIPESAETRRVAALARVGSDAHGIDVAAELDSLIDKVKDDDAARQRYIDLLEVMGADDPRTLDYRKQLTNRLF